jgi:lipopolysaccharide/colanic/teichoic acid biosynthesis glycosyltransferase
VLIGIAIRLQSQGPALFKQIRVGRHQQTFTCFKFRTMEVATPNVGTHEVSAALITKFGGFLRRTKLDELPQVFNIIMNEMSLVGPRPCLPSQFDVVAAREARGVFVAKPGITGLAQVRGIDMSNPDELASADKIYLQLQSILLDFKIIMQTALGKGNGDKVRRS